MSQSPDKPILLYNDECAVCRHIARWVKMSAPDKAGQVSIIERPIGDDPEALRALNPDLDIWQAYETVHVLMPDGSMRLGGEAVAEVLRNIPLTRWLAKSLAISAYGFRPFQMVLNLAYTVLADLRPLLGCESCGMPSAWLRPFVWLVARITVLFRGSRTATASPHFSNVVADKRSRLAKL